MAKAKLHTKTTKKMIQVDVQEETLTLELTKEEYRTLIVILRSVGGSEKNSPRKHSQSILNTIADSTPTWYPPGRIMEDDRESIYFKDNTLNELN